MATSSEGRCAGTAALHCLLVGQCYRSNVGPLSRDDPLRPSATNRMAKGLGQLEIHAISDDSSAPGRFMVAGMVLQGPNVFVSAMSNSLGDEVSR